MLSVDQIVVAIKKKNYHTSDLHVLPKLNQMSLLVTSMPTIKVNSATIYYEDTGTDGEVVVMSHGLLFSNRIFNHQVEVLKTNYRVIAYDHRGQGQSGVTKDGYEIDNLVDDAKELIERLELGAVHFIGMSMGGFVGMRLAARHSELVKSLTLINSYSRAETRFNKIKYSILSFIARWIGIRPVLGQILPIMFSKNFLKDPNRQDDLKYWKEAIMANDRVGITKAVKGVSTREDVTDELSNITCPTLIIYGEADNALPLSKARIMEEKISNSEFVTIPSVGHMSTIEAPEKVTPLIEGFLQG